MLLGILSSNLANSGVASEVTGALAPLFDKFLYAYRPKQGAAHNESKKDCRLRSNQISNFFYVGLSENILPLYIFRRGLKRHKRISCSFVGLETSKYYFGAMNN